MKRLSTLLLLICVALVGGPAAVQADGDPASDVLLGQNVFYPYQPPVSSNLQSRLDALASASAKAGFPLHIALIDSPVDLGIIPSVYGHPQSYAAFLEREISFQGPLPLLVVMPAGYGVSGVSGPVMTAAARLTAPRGRSSNDLAAAAIVAAASLAKAAGHPLAAGVGAPASAAAGGGGGGGGGGTPQIAVALAVLAVIVGLAFLVVTVRRHRTQS